MNRHGKMADAPRRFSPAQVLRGIEAFIAEDCGRRLTLDADASVVETWKAVEQFSSHECPLEFLTELAEYFQLDWSERRWVVWLKLRGDNSWTNRQRRAAWKQWNREIAPTIKVCDLVACISRRAPAPSLEPVTVFGHSCSAAGIFCGLCQLPEVDLLRVAPSTPLRKLGRLSRIRKLWKRIEWVSGVTLPPAKDIWPQSWPTLANVLGGGIALGVFGASIALGAMQRGPLYQIGGTIISMAALIAVIAFCGAIVDRLHNPLPEEVETFGDLARFIDRGRTGRASRGGYRN